MTPSDLRRDAYVWEQLSDSAKGYAHRMFTAGHKGLGFEMNSAAHHMAVAVSIMARLADELEGKQ